MIGWFRRWLRRMWRIAEPTLPVRSWQRYGDLRGDRLAGAASFYGFVSLFPLVLLSAVFASAIAGQSGIQTVQELVDENLPGFGSASDTGIDVASFYRNGGTVGLISGVGLIYTGLRWVDSVRAAVRSMWRVEDKPGNFVVRKMFDLVALGGLGLLLVASWGTSVVLRQTTRTLLDWLGLDGIDEAGTFQLVSWGLSVGVNTVLFSYLLSGLPRIVVPARNLIVTALLGAVAFEILKTFLVGYVVGPASNSAYAAFATPLAMLAWIYLVTRLLMLLAALTVESALDTLRGARQGARHPFGEARRGGRRRNRPKADYGDCAGCCGGTCRGRYSGRSGGNGARAVCRPAGTRPGYGGACRARRGWCWALVPRWLGGAQCRAGAAPGVNGASFG